MIKPIGKPNWLINLSLNLIKQICYLDRFKQDLREYMPKYISNTHPRRKAIQKYASRG